MEEEKSVGFSIPFKVSLYYTVTLSELQNSVYKIQSLSGNPVWEYANMHVHKHHFSLMPDK